MILGIASGAKTPNPQNFLKFVGCLYAEDMLALSVGRQTCDSQIMGLSPGWAPSLHSGHRQATYTCVHLSPSSIIWYQLAVMSLAGKVTMVLAESNGSLPLGL